MAGVGDLQRAVGAVQVVEQPVVALEALEVGEHGRPVPGRALVVSAQDRVPLVVVGGAAAHVDLRVDRGAAAEDVALRDVVHPAVQVLLRHGVVVGHVLAAVDQLEDARRHVEQRVVVGVAGLEQEHLAAAVRDQARGRDAAGAPPPMTMWSYSAVTVGPPGCGPAPFRPQIAGIMQSILSGITDTVLIGRASAAACPRPHVGGVRSRTRRYCPW